MAETATEPSRQVPATHFRLARFGCALAIFAALLGSTAPSPLYPIYIQTLGLKETTATAIFGIYAVGTLVALFVTGRLGRWAVDRRRVILPALMVTAAGALIFAVADNVAWLFVGRFLNGVGTGAITGLASTALYELAPAHKKRSGPVLATLAFTGGSAGGPLITSAMLAVGLAPTVAPFILIACMATLAWVTLALSAWPSAHANGAESAPIEPTDDKGSMSLFALGCLGVATAWMLGSVLMAVGANLGTNLYGLRDAAIAGLIPALFQIFAGVGQVVWGRVVSRRAMLIGFVGVIVAQVALALAAPSANGGLMMMIMPVHGFFYGALFVGALGQASAAAPPSRRARFVSRFYIVGYLSNVLPSLAMGMLIDGLGMASAFYLFSLTLITTAIIGVMVAVRLGRSR